MADNIKYRFIQNIGDYFPAGYFGEDFLEKVQKQAGYNAEQMKELCKPYVAFKAQYYDYKNTIINQRMRKQDAITYTHLFNSDLLKVLGYDNSHPYQEFVMVDEEKHEVIPVCHILRHNSRPTMFIMEMQHLIKTGDEEPDGLFEQQYDDGKVGQTDQQRYWAGQWSGVFKVPEGCKISPAIVNKAITTIFLLPEERRPRYILMLAGNVLFLFDKDRWSHGSYLMFSLDDLFSQASISTFRNYYALFHLLVCKETLAADSETVLMDALIEESYKSAYEVTKDLKNGVVNAVETLANEALYYMKYIAHKPFGKYIEATGEYDETDDDFEAEVKDDCLTIIYRLLFIFYAESRSELQILPTNDEIYNKGYSLEMLRDLEQVRLISEEARNGYFFDESLKHLFMLLGTGYKEELSSDDMKNRSFRVKHIDSPLFDDKRMKHLGNVKIRNVEWQKIICSLSLNNKNGRCGRISYANLGVNQLGSVYESLLAYRGFYAEVDYIEVHKANTPQDGTFLVPYNRMDDFDISEVLKDENGAPVILKRGTFVYRLNGRDRQKSASYYTPEVLTRSTVKYTLKTIFDEVSEGKRKATELLDLKILEPAMGAAAFQNEVINQLADAYLFYQQKQMREAGSPNWRIEPDHYRDELQKVKAYIATHNVYGVDLNPTAIELGKLSLWLNVMHKEMETPFFSNRICLGNAVVGAWLKVYDKKEIIAGRGRNNRLLPNAWWEKAPHKVKFNKNSVKRSVNEIYHFLLPDKNMLAVRSITEQKRLHHDEAERMNTILKDWIAPVSETDFFRLVRISSKIDYLLKEYLKFQCSIEAVTNNRKAIWGIPGDPILNLQNYEEKERLNATRFRHDSAYFRLKSVMDYWCSLWFWEFSDAAALPSRHEYWSDIESLLDVDTEKLLGNKTPKTITTQNGQTEMFATGGYQLSIYDQPSWKASEPPAPYPADEEIAPLSKEEIMAMAKGSDFGFFDTSERLGIVKRYADRYHFFHPMLEFLEVFWLRDGFDIICGNPPWLKLEFNEIGIISEKYPEIVIRNMSAPDVRKMRDRLFAAQPIVEQLYHGEENENAGSTAFMNAYCNYPLLVGQQTNLYKCVLENGFALMSDKGFMGLLHPETVYDDPKGQPLRKEIYKRLRYHFQYTNELTLFAEVDHHTKYGEQIYGSRRNEVDFQSIHNLFHPNTIDACFVHDGHGICGGIKDDNGKWNLAAHKDRIVHFTETELRVLSEAFENGADWGSVKLTSVHANVIVKVLEKLSKFPKHVRDYNDKIITRDIEETSGVMNGIIEKTNEHAQSSYDTVYSGPHFYVLNPFYKAPYKNYRVNNDYDVVNTCSIDDDYTIRELYKRKLRLQDYIKLIQGFYIGMDESGNDLYDNWIDYYKFAYRRMLGPNSERTFIGSIIGKGHSHLHTVNSVTFIDAKNVVEIASLASSLPIDFFVKVLNASDLTENRLACIPLGIADKYKPSLFSRTLLLNCLTTAYADLWQEMWNEEYKQETWSLEDPRLKPFSQLHDGWAWDIPLRNYFERRQALVEIDVISAMALGLSLEDLEMIYNIQFPVLQQNEDDTWYDAEGKIVFTCSKGLTGVGLDRPAWNAMRGEEIKDEQGATVAYKGAEATYLHTIDPAKSELYGGQQQTFVALYNRCDRLEDYRRAWEHFEKRFGKNMP